MSSALLDLVASIQSQFGAVFFVFLRMAAFFALLPGFGERTVPTRVKLGLAFAMTLIVLPAVTIDEMPLNVPFLILTEVAAGVMFGLGLRMFVLGLQTAGVIAAQATSLSQLLGGNGTDPLPAMGHILIVSGLALAMIADLHVKAAEFFILSYQIVPLGSFPNPEIIGQWGTHTISRVFILAFELSAPFVILSVIYNVALGAINRAMPQLMVAFVGAPLITAGGLFLLFLMAPTMLMVWMHSVDQFLSAPMSGNW
jgi:flagellar biosynthetic protein FliR